MIVIAAKHLDSKAMSTLHRLSEDREERGILVNVTTTMIPNPDSI